MKWKLGEDVLGWKAQKAYTITQFFKGKFTEGIRNTISRAGYGKQAMGTFS